MVFDIFRCSTTVHCLAEREGGPLFVAPSLEEAAADPRTREMRVFSELSKPVDCRERYDNSPLEATRRPWEAGLSSLVATTTGTPAMFAARRFERVYVGSLVSFPALVAELAAYPGPITLIPAAYPHWNHVEDEIAAQAVATALEGFANLPEFVRECAASARERILASHRPAVLEGKLPTAKEDIALALEIGRCPFALSLAFDQSSLARVGRV